MKDIFLGFREFGKAIQRAESEEDEHLIYRETERGRQWEIVKKLDRWRERKTEMKRQCQRAA